MKASDNIEPLDSIDRSSRYPRKKNMLKEKLKEKRLAEIFKR